MTLLLLGCFSLLSFVGGYYVGFYNNKYISNINEEWVIVDRFKKAEPEKIPLIPQPSAPLEDSYVLNPVYAK